MKKLLLLAGLLVVAASAFAAEAYDAPKTDSEAEIGVHAEVLEDLVIAKQKDVNFGVLRKGSTKDAPEEDGEFTITGSKGTKVLLSVKDAKGEADYRAVDGNAIPVVLSLTGVTEHDNNKAFKQMTSLLKIYDNNNNEVTNEEVILDSGDYKYGTAKSFVSSFKVKGSVTTDPGQFGGKYNGTLMVKVKHSGWLDGRK
ncbi:hypothetical protein [Fusobacterium ulcerans]|uniref:hypothetical protein n=1 Tax=Fusobacterium ulcerans TaxID=861 RepID=UPI003FEEFCF7